MPDKKQLLAALKQCRNRRVMVVGDIMLDEYHWCDVSRISPEAPVPVCRVRETTLVPGGAANVAHNIQILGSVPYLVGVLGHDSTGKKLMQKLKENHMLLNGIIQDDRKPTILKSRIVAHQQHVARVDREDSEPVSGAVQQQLLDRIQQFLPVVDAIVISDYLKGTLPDRLVALIIKAAKQQHKKVIVDPKGDYYLKYKEAFVLTPNFHEFETAVRKRVKTEAEVQKEALKLIHKLKLESLLITRSEKGMSLVQKTGAKLDIETRAQEVFDITGAGDTVIGMLAVALASGCSVSSAAQLANYAAGVVVGKIGTSTVTLDEIKTAISAD